MTVTTAAMAITTALATGLTMAATTVITGILTVIITILILISITRPISLIRLWSRRTILIITTTTITRIRDRGVRLPNS
jgi:hypothetical protein